MKITFLGTSYGAPSVGRRQQSVLVETENSDACIFDAGAPITDVLVNMGYDFSRIKAVFISHLHGDHMNGINDLINLCEFLNARFTVYLPEKRGVEALTAYTEMQLDGRACDRVCFREYSSGVVYLENGCRITAYPTAHMEKAGRPSYGFMAEADQSSVYITGDLHPTLKDIPDVLNSVHTDMIVTECAHFAPSELYGRLDACNTDRVAFVHVMPPERYNELKALQNDRSFSSLFPNDGDAIEFFKK
ncbi:MAG: MBL fold metallo-hydrolase [Clostridia bacterium]|nr:MBL fold metallo-hydrolase [Clostridia bacterium]